LCEQALALEPRNVEALYDSGVALINLRRFEEAEAVLQRAIALNPGFKDAILVMADNLRILNRPQDALQWYRRFLELSPAGEDADNARRQIADLAAR